MDCVKSMAEPKKPHNIIKGRYLAEKT